MAPLCWGAQTWAGLRIGGHTERVSGTISVGGMQAPSCYTEAKTSELVCIIDVETTEINVRTHDAMHRMAWASLLTAS